MEFEIPKVVKSAIETLLNTTLSMFNQITSNKLLEYQVQEYVNNFCSKTILHRVEPITLPEFYQPLHLEKKNKKYATSSATELFSKYNYISIVGYAGSGKSTIVKHLFTKCFEEKFRIPIKIELRVLNGYNGTLTQYITKEIFSYFELGVDAERIGRLLNTSPLVFFFDGYDEININDKEKRTNELIAFTSKFPNNKYVITSRPYTNIEMLPMFTNFSVCKLEDNEINDFIKKQIPKKNAEIAEKMITEIEKDENQAYRSFLDNPLLLSMFIMTFQSYSELPKRKCEFYHQVFETLFSHHDSLSKLGFTRDKAAGLAKSQYEVILRILCFITFEEDNFIIKPTELENTLNLIKNVRKDLKFENDLLVYDLQVAIGILIKEGNEYAFPHRSLQEYFAACFFQNFNKENKDTFYTQAYGKIKSALHSLLHQSNFYSILREVDDVNVITRIGIPYLQYLLGNLNDLYELTQNVDAAKDEYALNEKAESRINYQHLLLKEYVQYCKAYFSFSILFSIIFDYAKINPVLQSQLFSTYAVLPSPDHKDVDLVYLTTIKSDIEQLVQNLNTIKTDLNNFCLNKDNAESKILKQYLN